MPRSSHPCSRATSRKTPTLDPIFEQAAAGDLEPADLVEEPSEQLPSRRLLGQVFLVHDLRIVVNDLIRLQLGDRRHHPASHALDDVVVLGECPRRARELFDGDRSACRGRVQEHHGRPPAQDARTLTSRSGSKYPSPFVPAEGHGIPPTSTTSHRAPASRVEDAREHVSQRANDRYRRRFLRVPGWNRDFHDPLTTGDRVDQQLRIEHEPIRVGEERKRLQAASRVCAEAAVHVGEP